MAWYLLDSNAFLWFKVKPQILRPQARQEIENGRNELFVSLASLWELWIKASAGRLGEYEELFRGDAASMLRSLQESGFALLPIELHYAIAAARLPRHHADPFDRMLIAQAMSEGLTIISSDNAFRRYSSVKVLRA
jgi:PIN domain nuclease of toxin-antitoxin system